MNLLIQIDGGLVRDVFYKGKGPLKNVVVIDFDTEGAEPKELTIAKDNAGKEFEAYIHTIDVKELPDDCDVERIYKEYLKK